MQGYSTNTIRITVIPEVILFLIDTESIDFQTHSLLKEGFLTICKNIFEHTCLIESWHYKASCSIFCHTTIQNMSLSLNHCCRTWNKPYNDFLISQTINWFITIILLSYRFIDFLENLFCYFWFLRHYFCLWCNINLYTFHQCIIHIRTFFYFLWSSHF